MLPPRPVKNGECTSQDMSALQPPTLDELLPQFERQEVPQDQARGPLVLACSRWSNMWHFQALLLQWSPSVPRALCSFLSWEMELPSRKWAPQLTRPLIGAAHFLRTPRPSPASEPALRQIPCQPQNQNGATSHAQPFPQLSRGGALSHPSSHDAQ